eukprot:2555464-Prymnesium_polylepis.1
MQRPPTATTYAEELQTHAVNITTVMRGTFSTEAELRGWMEANGIDTSGYGKGKAKHLVDLFKEIDRKESTLQLLGGKVYRCLAVMKLVVRQKGKMQRHLACYAQTMTDGRKRERDILPSEKMFDGEVPHIAAVRGLIEEFSSVGADETNSDLDPNSLLTWDEVIESPSFPNLTTQYHMHQMTATVSNALPSVNFITHEDDGQGRKEHFWEWRLDSPDDKRRKREEERPAGQEIEGDSEEELWSDDDCADTDSEEYISSLAML